MANVCSHSSQGLLSKVASYVATVWWREGSNKVWIYIGDLIDCEGWETKTLVVQPDIGTQVVISHYTIEFDVYI